MPSTLWMLVLLLLLMKTAVASTRAKDRAIGDELALRYVDRVVVSIPAVRKGLSNQRMRVIQDVVSAVTLGLSVRLPRALTSRKGCHYESTCYMDYQTSLDFWRVFDREQTLKALANIGVKVVSNDDSQKEGLESTEAMAVSPLAWPLTHSELAAQSGAVWRWVAEDAAKGGREHRNVSSTRLLSIAIANPSYCCLLLLPDTTAAVVQIARVNNALVSAKHTRDHAMMVLAAYRARLQPAEPTARTCAVHWRDDDDFVVSNHKLDRRAYKIQMARAIASLEGCGGALLVLGDISTRRLRPLLSSIAAAYCAGTDTSSRLANVVANETAQCPDFATRRLYNKQSLLRSVNWTAEYEGWDDLLGMVDFELGTRVDSFVGSPFSSFSVLIALARGDTRALPQNSAAHKHTLMPKSIDVDDSLAQLFRIQFPYAWSTVTSDPCVVSRQDKEDSRSKPSLSQAIRSMSEKYAKRLEAHPSCVFDDRAVQSDRSVRLLRAVFIFALAALYFHRKAFVRTQRRLHCPSSVVRA